MKQFSTTPYLSVVIPVYNEERRIEMSLRKVYEYLESQKYDYEVIISDDGSTDRTREIVKNHIKGRKNLVLLENPHKGKAPAIISGVFKANGRYVLFTDVDLSVPIDEAGKMLTWSKNHNIDVAIASREAKGAKRINEPYLRHFMGRVFNLLVQIVVLPGINDTQCGFKLFKSRAVKEIFKRLKLYSLDSPEITGAKVSGFDVEFLYVARSLGYNVREVPVTWTYGENSKVHSLKDSFYNLKDVIKVRINILKGAYK